MWLKPKQISDQEADGHDVMPGWWAIAEDGTPVSGPYPSREAAMVGIGKRGADQPTGRPGEAGPSQEE